MRLRAAWQLARACYGVYLDALQHQRKVLGQGTGTRVQPIKHGSPCVQLKSVLNCSGSACMQGSRWLY